MISNCLAPEEDPICKIMRVIVPISNTFTSKATNVQLTNSRQCFMTNDNCFFLSKFGLPSIVEINSRQCFITNERVI